MQKHKNLDTRQPVRRRYTFWDFLCVISIVGVWPRFIEPSIISVSHKKAQVSKLPVDKLKILQISDLHLTANTSKSFLRKIINKAKFLQPDIIVFTGDFSCYGNIQEPNLLRQFLQQFNAPYGCYAVLGNHDYESYLSINANGDYDLTPAPKSMLKQAFLRFFKTSPTLTGLTTQSAKNLSPNKELVELLADTPFQLLHNRTVSININGGILNLTGLGEHMAADVLPQKAFGTIPDSKEHSRIILLHNPDGLPLLKNYPGEIVLCGHTHGGQINLPWLWKKFTLLENRNFKKGILKIDGKWVYINRGIGGALPFRWFSTPEILLLTLEQHGS